MAWFRRKPDPVSQRAKALEAQISELEAEIEELQSVAPGGQPRVRSIFRTGKAEHPNPDSASPVLEPVDDEVIRTATADETARSSFGSNTFGAGMQTPGGPNPSHDHRRLVHYLAAGGIQGLRPLRYERRVARNRFLLMFFFLLLMLLGIFAIFRDHL